MVLDKVGHASIEPSSIDLQARRQFLERAAQLTESASLRENALRNRRSERRELRRGHADTMIGIAASDRKCALRHIEAAHLLAFADFPTALGPITGVADSARFRLQKITIKTEDAFRVSEGVTDTLAGARIHRIILRPDHLRELRLQVRHQRGARGRGRRLGEERQPGATDGRIRVADLRQQVIDLRTTDLVAGLGRNHRAVGIVEVEHGGLGGKIGGASVGQIRRVSLELGRAALMALGQQRNRAASGGHRGGVVLRQPGRDPFDGFAVRKNIHFRATAAGHAEPPERERGGHEAEEIPAVDAVEIGRALRKLAFEVLLEAGRLGEFVEAAPVARTVEFAGGGGGMFERVLHRWQPLQLCGGFTFQCSTSFAASAALP